MDVSDPRHRSSWPGDAFMAITCAGPIRGMINCSRPPALTQKTRTGSVPWFSKVTRVVVMGWQGEARGYPAESSADAGSQRARPPSQQTSARLLRGKGTVVSGTLRGGSHFTSALSHAPPHPPDPSPPHHPTMLASHRPGLRTAASGLHLLEQRLQVRGHLSRGRGGGGRCGRAARRLLLQKLLRDAGQHARASARDDAVEGGPCRARPLSPAGCTSTSMEASFGLGLGPGLGPG